MEVMIKNRPLPVVFVVRTVGGGVTVVDGSAGAAIQNLRERNYSGWIGMGRVTHRIPTEVGKG